MDRVITKCTFSSLSELEQRYVEKQIPRCPDCGSKPDILKGDVEISIDSCVVQIQTMCLNCFSTYLVTLYGERADP